MEFVLAHDWHSKINLLSDRLKAELRTKKVLWLVSGGSNIDISIAAAKTIPENLTNNLTVALIDERFGDIGHTDSNWQQLMDAKFSVGNAKLEPPLLKGLTFEETVDYYNVKIIELFNENDVVIGQLGLGEDGHIAGILPNSPATIETDDYVLGYESNPYTRFTLTFKAITKIDAIYVFAFGDNKKFAINNLRSKNLHRNIQPAQILKEIGESYIITDRLEIINEK